MAVQRIDIEAFLERSVSLPVFDVRSPCEYAHAHIPGAKSFPLFNDEERKVIGTTYKQVSREQAIKIGLDYFGPKMRPMIEEAERICKVAASGKSLLLHCWRGGMRSSAVAWLLDFYGFEVFLLEGGYKAYRHWVIAHWHGEGAFRILAGNTGSGKTKVLLALKESGEPVLDLEGLAQHKGSAFGGLDKIPQPSQEMFENLLATSIHALRKKFGDRPIWIEDESQRIGNINIPAELFKKWSTASSVFLDVDFEQRLTHITSEYGGHSTESLINAIVRIKKRLGPLETKMAIACLIEGDTKECFRILLRYYDKHYYPAGHRDIHSFSSAGKDVQQIAAALKSQYS